MLQGADLIVGADVVWLPALVEPLVQTLKWLTDAPARGSVGVGGGGNSHLDGVEPRDTASAASASASASAAGGGGAASPPPPPILLAHKTRSRATDTLLWAKIEAAGFVRTQIKEGFAAGFADDDIAVWRLQRML